MSDTSEPRTAPERSCVECGKRILLAYWQGNHGPMCGACTAPRKPETLRDRFAMAALTGLVAGYLGRDPDDNYAPNEIAELVFEFADAMLAERAKSTTARESSCANS